MPEHAIDLDWAALGPMLERGAELHAPLYDDAVRWVRSVASPGREDARGGAAVGLVVDIGAGPGVISCLLARTFPSARVVAVDGTPELLARARVRAEREGVGDRVEVQVADLPEDVDHLITEGLRAADLVWTSHVLHHLGDQQRAAGQLGRLLRPGGLLAVAEGGLPMRSLPRDIGLGRPGLQARLDAADEDWFAQMRAELPGAAPAVEHWPGLLAGAGLEPSGSRTFLLDLPAPLGAAGRELVRRRFARMRETLEGRLDADDLVVLDQLLEDGGPHALEQRADVFVLVATTVHLAIAPA